MFISIFDMFTKYELFKALLETLVMVFVPTIFAYLIGFPLGILVVITKKGGIAENRVVNKILDIIINIGRSIPFIILIIALMPLSRVILGNAIGLNGMIVPLIIGSVPFVARLVQQSLEEVNQGVVDAAITMGFTKFQIITKVYLRESIPSLIKGVALTLIMLIGYSAMSGVVGDTGIGNIAVVEGRINGKLLLLCIVIIVILVQIIQVAFDLLAKALDKKRRA